MAVASDKASPGAGGIGGHLHLSRLGFWPLPDMPTVREEESKLGHQYPPQTKIGTHFKDKWGNGPGTRELGWSATGENSVDTAA